MSRTDYVIDSADRILSGSGGLGAADGASDWTALIGRSLYDSIAGEETRSLYRALLERVRGSGQTVEVPFRCDAPALRRFMTLEIVPHGDVIAFTATLDLIEPREAPALGPVLSDDSVLVMCSWCKRVRLDDWLEVEDAMALLLDANAGSKPSISHGVCEPCADRVGAYLGAASSL